MCEIEFGGHRISIKSRAGIETCCYIDNLDLAFDMGIDFNRAYAMSNVFISHGHIDHIHAIVKHASHRQLFNLKKAHYYIPSHLLAQVRAMFQSFADMQEDPELATYATLVPIKVSTSRSMKPIAIKKRKGMTLVPFPTVHRVDSLGFCLYQEKSHLKAQYQALSGKEISKLRKEKQDMFTVERHLELAFTGDTTIDIFNTKPELFNARILIMEMTFIDDKVSREKSKSMGHIHLHDMLELADQFHNECIILYHFSTRYSRQYVQKVVSDKVPTLWPRIRIAL